VHLVYHPGTRGGQARSSIALAAAAIGASIVRKAAPRSETARLWITGAAAAFAYNAIRRSRAMTIHITAIQPLVALLAGILILLVPRILNYVIAIYLIFIGVIGLWPDLLNRFPH
jgi:Protein of unknown function (DUF3096)